MKKKSERYPWKPSCRKKCGGLAYACGIDGDLLFIFINCAALDEYRRAYNLYHSTELAVLDRYKDSRRISHAIVTNLFLPVTMTQNLLAIRDTFVKN